MYTQGGIYYELLEGFPKFKRSRDSMSGVEQYLISWSNIDAFLNESITASYVVGTTYFPPVYRTMPGVPYLLTEDIEIEPFVEGLPGGTGVGYSTLAKVTINYATSSKAGDESQQNQPTFVFNQSINVGGEFLTLSAAGLKWEGTSTAIKGDDVQAGKMIPTLEHELKWDNIINPPFAAIRDMIGKVNGTGFNGASVETLLFLGAQMTRQGSVEIGVHPWDITYKFSEKIVKQGGLSVGWNHFFRPDTGKFHRLKQVDGNAIYDSAAFDYLFQFQ